MERKPGYTNMQEGGMGALGHAGSLELCSLSSNLLAGCVSIDDSTEIIPEKNKRTNTFWVHLIVERFSLN